jgi:hypothetical protein
MNNKAKIIVVLLALALLPVGCKKDTCQECSDPVQAGCPKLIKQCPGYTMTVQQCSGGCCTTDVSQISCTADFPGQIMREEIIGDTVVIEANSGSERTTVFISGGENGWVTADMPETEVRCVMERKLAEIRAGAHSLQ